MIWPYRGGSTIKSGLENRWVDQSFVSDGTEIAAAEMIQLVLLPPVISIFSPILRLRYFSNLDSERSLCSRSLMLKQHGHAMV